MGLPYLPSCRRQFDVRLCVQYIAAYRWQINSRWHCNIFGIRDAAKEQRKDAAKWKLNEERSFFQFSTKFNKAQVLFVFINGSLRMRLELGNAYGFVGPSPSPSLSPESRVPSSSPYNVLKSTAKWHAVVINWQFTCQMINARPDGSSQPKRKPQQL